MMWSSPRDNWERLVAAAVKKDQIWQLCHQDSVTTVSSNSHRTSHSSSSEEILSISSSRSRRIPLSSPRQTLHTSSQASTSNSGIQKIFSALLGRRNPKDYDMGLGLAGIPEDNSGLQSFSLRELRVATDNFSNRNVLRRGGNSTVYKGRLQDGSLVAVKRLTRETKNMGKELEVTSIAAHHNVIRARGFCITGKEQLLVYAYMVNGSVASCLRERQEPLPLLDWPVRKRIAVGAAKGLAYLHYNCPRKIIHRDVKAANILLDEDLEAVICDFNLAEFVDSYQDDGVRGTIGHIAPEYLATGKCSVKNDVFGYGIFLLELITAQKSFDLARVANDNDVMLLNVVKGSYEGREWKNMVDAELQSDLVDEEVEMLLQIALICTQTDPERRPTMTEVVRALEVGYGLAERYEEWYREKFDVENLELRDLRRFTIQELQAATDDFSNNVISKDGFNMIYKGWLDGSPVAVKRYTSQSLEYYFEKEFDIGRICLHPNIVHVIGFCKTPAEQLLVFRFMVNGSVESWLKGRDESRPPLTWQKRRKIALGAARGLAFLHDRCEKKIINRNVKASNILLDENFEAVVADFKLAKLINHYETHATTIVAGTVGHIAPEYLASGQCWDKTDVFGYGAFLLELVTGQRIIDFLEAADDEVMFRPDWVKRNYEERRWESLADKDSEDDLMEAVVVVKKLVQISVLCTQYDPNKRPRMSDVVRMLEFGDVLRERSEERLKKEVRKEEGPPEIYLNSELIEDGNSYSLTSEQLSGPR